MPIIAINKVAYYRFLNLLVKNL